MGNVLLSLFFPPFTILSTIFVPLNCEPNIIRMRATLGLLLIKESSVASLTCYSFYALILYLFIMHVCLDLKTCLPLLLDEVGPEICIIYTFANETNVHNYNVLPNPSLCRFETQQLITCAQYCSL